MRRKLGALLLALPFVSAVFTAFPATQVWAAERSGYAGAEGYGVVLKHADSPVEVEKAVVTFSISEFFDPAEGITAENYASRVTTEYTFYNPTDEDVKLSLLLPGTDKTYTYEVAGDESDYCFIRSENQCLDYSIRKTYSDSLEFRLEDEVVRVRDEKQTTDFLSPSSPVYTYSAKLRAGPALEEGAFLHIYAAFNPVKTILLYDGAAKLSIENGVAHFVWQSDSPGTFVVYSVGAKAEFSTEVCEDANGQRPLKRYFLETSNSETTFGELVESRRESKDIGEVDWYNGFVDMLESKSRYGISYVSIDWFDESAFHTWYEYGITVPAHGRAVNSVEILLLPAVDMEGPFYTYAYQAVPLPRRWSDFKQIEINIQTPFYLYRSSLDFEPYEGGYRYSRTELFAGELDLVLAESANVRGGKEYDDGFTSNVLITIILLAVFVSAAVVGGMAAFVSGRKRKK